MTTASQIKPAKILLVEDEPLWQEAISTLLAQDSNCFKIVETVDSFINGLNAFLKHQPQFILLDWQINGPLSGIDLGNKLMELGLPSHQIILISGANPGSIPPHEFLYVPKSRLSEELLPLLKSLHPN